MRSSSDSAKVFARKARWRRSRQAHESVSPERDATATKSSGCPRLIAEPEGGASGCVSRVSGAGVLVTDRASCRAVAALAVNADAAKKVTYRDSLGRFW